MASVFVVGGHGQVALRLAGRLAPTHRVTSMIRDPAHAADLTAISPAIKPLVLSLEDSSVPDLAKSIAGYDVVVFSAGAGGKGGPERTKQVDYEGAVKVFDALEAVQGTKPRLVLVSALDVRNPDGPWPAHYDETDKEMSRRMRAAIGTYYHWKYEADKNLVARTAFQWTILRPGGLVDTPGTGRASIGRTHMVPQVPRDDVAHTLALLVDRPDAAGLAIDLVGGATPIPEALDAFIKKGESDWIG